MRKKKEEIKNVPYALVVGCLMYAMGWTRLDIAHGAGVVNMFLYNPCKELWVTMKWIFK